VNGGELETLLENCTRCGLCREVCIVERLGAHSITSFLCGEEEYSSWLCSSCWRCQEVCPRGVDIHSIIIEKRRQERPPAGHESNLVNVLRLGYALEVDDSVNELRRFHGLDEVQLIPAEWVKVLLSGWEQGSTGG
jgi:heterodisulfide reductase subunit C